MTQIVIGVDGGGSKTHVIVADEHGQTLAEATGPGSAVRPGQAEVSAGVIAEVVREAVASPEVAGATARMLHVGVAGAGREAERDALRQALLAHDLALDITVVPDFTIALDDAFGDGAGVLLIAGTGSSAFGRSPTGLTARAGGWGPVCGDEGSGAWIGRKALSVVTAAADGREPPTALTGAVLTAAELNDAPELIAWAASATPATLATLAPVVFATANSGDLRANAIVTLAVEELLLHVRALARDLFGDERAAIPMAMAGGLLQRGSVLRKRLEHRLKSGVPGAQVRPADVVPARGAVRSAVLSVRTAAVA
jgi:glucosamine kinase